MNILSVIVGNGNMLLAFQVVLIIIGLAILARLILCTKESTSLGELVEYVSHPVLYYVFPLILVSWLTRVDSSGFLVLIAYYLLALLIAIKEIIKLIESLKKLVSK